MIQDTQYLKSEIMAALDSLSPESLNLIAKFISFLQLDTSRAEVKHLDEMVEVETSPGTMHISSPRLVHKHQLADLQKEIIAIES
ncbi:MAG: hypothetical protein R3A44_40620 [Caldilineaceae bacterium]